jgi:hypothetical protein
MVLELLAPIPDKLLVCQSTMVRLSKNSSSLQNDILASILCFFRATSLKDLSVSYDPQFKQGLFP